MPPEKSIERLSVYRRLLYDLHQKGERKIFSHQLASLAGRTSAQVRRDIMNIGYTGSPSRGYDIANLVDSISEVLDTPLGQGVALVGVGNLGRALLAYFSDRRPRLKIVAAFDNNPDRTGRVIHGCRCYLVEELAEVVNKEEITVGILTVPAEAAQIIAEQMYGAGIRGILNFAPVPIAAPRDMYVESMDVTMALEKVAYFARQQNEE